MKPVFGMCAVLLLAGVGASKVQAAEPEAVSATEAAAAPAAEEKVIYTFKNDDQMKTFAQQWQQRRGMLVRMSVLKAYFDEEQARLQELDQKLAADYKIDVNKNYMLDSKQRVIIETAVPAAEGAAAPAPEAPPAP